MMMMTSLFKTENGSVTYFAKSHTVSCLTAPSKWT